MRYNSYTYLVVKVAGIPEVTVKSTLSGAGFPLSYPVSTDGSLAVVDKLDNVQVALGPALVPAKPAYVLEEMPDWPYLTHEEALQLTHYEATSEGASDGFVYRDKPEPVE